MTWQSIETLLPVIYEGGVFLTGAHLDVPGDATFHIKKWPVFIRYNMSEPALSAFKQLGVTHWMLLPELPK